MESVTDITIELLEQTTIDLVKSLLNSNKLKLEQKFEVLETLLISEGDSHSTISCPTLADGSLASMTKSFT